MKYSGAAQWPTPKPDRNYLRLFAARLNPMVSLTGRLRVAVPLADRAHAEQGARLAVRVVAVRPGQIELHGVLRPRRRLAPSRKRNTDARQPDPVPGGSRPVGTGHPARRRRTAEVRARISHRSSRDRKRGSSRKRHDHSPHRKLLSLVTDPLAAGFSWKGSLEGQGLNCNRP